MEESIFFGSATCYFTIRAIDGNETEREKPFFLAELNKYLYNTGKIINNIANILQHVRQIILKPSNFLHNGK